MTEEKLNEMSGALATETIDQVLNEESEIRNTPIEEEVADQSSDESDQSDRSDKSDKSDRSENTDSPAEKELAEMTEKMGAEAVLEMIRCNRNRIIDELIAEAKTEYKRRPMPSGVSCERKAASIFDIAGMA